MKKQIVKLEEIRFEYKKIAYEIFIHPHLELNDVDIYVLQEANGKWIAEITTLSDLFEALNKNVS